MKGIVFRSFVPEIIDEDGFILRIDNPIFPNTCRLVLEQLFGIIHLLTSRRHNLYDPVRRTLAAGFIQLIRIADHTDARFDISFIICM